MVFGSRRRPLDDAWAAEEAGGKVAERLADEIERQRLESRRVTETTSYRYAQEPAYRAEVDDRYARVDAAVAEAEALDQILERGHFRRDLKLLGIIGAFLVAGVVVSLALVANERPGSAASALCCALPLAVAVPLGVLRDRARKRKRASRERMKAARTLA